MDTLNLYNIPYMYISRYLTYVPKPFLQLMIIFIFILMLIKNELFRDQPNFTQCMHYYAYHINTVIQYYTVLSRESLQISI